MPQPAVAIVADDLTGALDSAVPFARLGHPTLVATGPAALPDALAAARRTGARVLALSTNGREAPAATAAAAAGQAARLLAGAGTLFKKLDSRLKGHPAAELAAIAQVLRPPPRTLVCPAIPELGRHVRAGAVTGRGVAEPIPVAPLFPPGTLCPDAESDADLDRILATAPPGTLLAGARGLASALARRLSPASALPAGPPQLPGPFAFIIGSRDPITLEQVARLRSGARVLWLPAPDGVLPPAARGTPPAADAPPLILQATPGPSAPDTPTPGPIVAARLAAASLPRLSGRATLVLTGGETAAAVLSALGIHLLDVIGEVLPGLPVSRPHGQPHGPLIVTKSGGFGTADSLLRLLPAPTPRSAVKDTAAP